MLIPPEDASHAKAWLMKKLPAVSDTETDILADYVLLFVSQDEGLADIQTNLERELQEFLTPDTIPGFVDQVLRGFQHKSYLPGAQSPPPKAASLPTGLEAQIPPIGGENKKRSFQEAVEFDGAGGHGQPAPERPTKQPKRGQGRRGGPLANPRGQGRGGPNQSSPPPGHPAIPPGFGGRGGPQPGFDPRQENGPLRQPPTGPAAQSYPAAGPPMSYGATQPPRRGKPCRDFKNKGFCSRGDSCQYDHGSGAVSMPPLDPSMGQPSSEQFTEMMSFMMNQNAQHFQELMNVWLQSQQANGNQGKGRKSDRGGKQRGPRQKRGGRAAISAEGPDNTQSKCTIVVESIPEEQFTDEAVRGFFSEFGDIQEVSLQPYKRMAVVKFDSWESANAAYRSPKVIFDNRFVKVFWFKGDDTQPLPAPGSIQGPNDMEAFDGDPGGYKKKKNRNSSTEAEPEEPQFDMEEFMKKQEEAQKRHDEYMQKKEEIEKQREELEQKQRDLVGRQREVRQKLREKLGGETDGSGGENASSSDALRAQLAALEEEAMILGLDPDADDASSIGGADGGFSFRGRGRGRGASRGRGRGGFVPRGRGRGAYRGGFGRGRGGGDVHAAYAAYSLDNRPKVVAVSGVDFSDSARDEALRQHLLTVGEFTDIENTPTATEVTFKDRRTAETFFYSLTHTGEVPGVDGKVEVSWVSKPLPPVALPGQGGAEATAAQGGQSAEFAADEDDDEDGDAAMHNASGDPAAGRDGERERVDMDFEQAEDGEWFE